MGVATVCIDSPLPHLDSGFDYQIPERLGDVVVVGTRVRVPFRGRLTSGVVLERAEESQFAGTLSDIRTAAPVPSFTADAIDLARAIAQRYCGSLWDVLRIMAPPRVASVDKRPWEVTIHPREVWAAAAPDSPVPISGASTRSVWVALPPDPPHSTVPARDIAAWAVNLAATGRQAIVTLPDERAIRSVSASLEAMGLRLWSSRSGGDVAVIDHHSGPAPRYGAYLAAMHGHVGVVIGSRPTVLQPLARPGGILIWDCGASVYDEPHAPYPHSRVIAAMRAERGMEVVLASYAPSVDAMALVDHGWAHAHLPSHHDTAFRRPVVDVLDDDARQREGGSGAHWMPSRAWRALLKGSESGPVAVVVPRAGYVSASSCARCGAWAACHTCGTTLMVPQSGAHPMCESCDELRPDWHCHECHHSVIAAKRQGVQAIAEQLARMAPSVTVSVSSAATGTLPDLSVSSGIVVATPGALPAVDSGYRHVALSHAHVSIAGGIDADYQQLRWWTNASALVARGGSVSFIGEAPPALLRALQTWGQAVWAHESAKERRELALPPYRRSLTLSGPADAVAHGVATVLSQCPSATVARGEVTTILLDRGEAPATIEALRALQRERSKRSAPALMVRVDGPLRL